MKAKAIIAAILTAQNDLTNDARLIAIQETVAGLTDKCDQLLKDSSGNYPWAVSGLSFAGVSFRADRFKMADEPWRAVMHGLRMHGFDPAQAGLYPGGFMVAYIKQRVTKTINQLMDRKVDGFEFASVLATAIKEIKEIMIKHGWEVALTQSPLIIEVINYANFEINRRLQRVVLETVELAEEAIDLRANGENITGKQHDRMTGVERYVRNNRQKIEGALTLMTADSPLKLQEERILALLAEVARDVNIPRPEKKAYEPKSAKPQNHKKGNAKGKQHGGNKPNQIKHHDFRGAGEVILKLDLPESTKPTDQIIVETAMALGIDEVSMVTDDDRVPDIDNRSRTVSEILSTTR